MVRPLEYREKGISIEIGEKENNNNTSSIQFYHQPPSHKHK